MMLRTLAAAAALCAAAALRTSDPRLAVVPAPKHLQLGSPTQRPLAPGFHVDTTTDAVAARSERLRRAAARYAALWRPAAASAPSALRSVRVVLSSSDEALGPDTDYSYTLRAAEDDATVYVTAATPYGAAYALESFTQLLEEGAVLPYASVDIDDAPAYNHRGMMIDTGRRFFPVPTLQNVMDTMAAVKLNVLHLHASDHCRLAIETKKFPNVTAALVGVLGGYYSWADVAGIVSYAADRGIRVVPEWDVPGHSRGLLPLQGYGAQFCTPSAGYGTSQLYGDAGNVTVGIVEELYSELSALFPDAYVHIGADETAVTGQCDIASTFQFERELLDFVESPSGLNKVAAGWEEVLFDAGAATNATIVFSWSRHSPGEVVALGRRAIACNSSHLYLTQPGGAYPAGWESFYFDVSETVPAGQKGMLLGAEMSSWTDTYCYEPQCGAFSGATPVAAVLFPPSADAEFATSIGGMLWPRGYVGASAFWSYNSSVDSQSAAFTQAIWSLNDGLIQRGALACPSNCVCTQLTQCGQPIIPPTPIAPNATVSVKPCTLPVPPGQAFALAADGTLRLNGTLCLASPNGSGNPSYPLVMQPCDTGKAVVHWQHTGAANALRVVDSATGACLDMEESSGSVGEYDCGSDEPGLLQLNQAWAVDGSGQPGVVVNLENGGCLTAS